MALKNNNFKKLLNIPSDPGKYIKADYIVILFSSPNKKQIIIEGLCSLEGTPTGSLYFGTFEMDSRSTTLLSDFHQKAISVLGDGFEIVDLK